MLTALSVARDCRMIDPYDRIIIVSARPPPTAAASGELVSPKVDTAPSGLLELPDSPLVEFHYAEDLHEPVTEIAATTGDRHGAVNGRCSTDAAAAVCSS